MEDIVAQKYVSESSSSPIPSSDTSKSDPFVDLRASPYFANLRGEVCPLPTLDFSCLISQDPDQRSNACRQLLQACQDWGFFFLVNHGIPEEKLDTIIRAGKEFFELPEDDRNRYKEGLFAMTYGRDDIVYTSTKTNYLWRDSLKLNLHPKEFHLPHKPQLLREMVVEYSRTIKELTKTLMEAIAEALELDKQKMEEKLKLDDAFQMFIANYYPPCPKTDETMAMPPHSDLGLFAFLIQNGVPGLQLMKDGRWFNAGLPDPQQNCILVNVADQLEIYSNGRCKSVIHRASTNEKEERISVVMTSGPSLEAVVEAAEELLQKDGQHGRYAPRTYSDYMQTKYIKNPFHCE